VELILAQEKKNGLIHSQCLTRCRELHQPEVDGCHCAVLLARSGQRFEDDDPQLLDTVEKKNDRRKILNLPALDIGGCRFLHFGLVTLHWDTLHCCKVHHVLRWEREELLP
jgi:hypothetical protein